VGKYWLHHDTATVSVSAVRLPTVMVHVVLPTLAVASGVIAIKSAPAASEDSCDEIFTSGAVHVAVWYAPGDGADAPSRTVTVEYPVAPRATDKEADDNDADVGVGITTNPSGTIRSASVPLVTLLWMYWPPDATPDATVTPTVTVPFDPVVRVVFDKVTPVGA